jgi:putative restriction endonuclease
MGRGYAEGEMASESNFGPTTSEGSGRESFRVGMHFTNRKTLFESGLHPHPMNGITWLRDGPARSVVISGGYEDDEDWGDTILYTGMGGRSRAGDQMADQPLNAGNRSLVRAMEWRTPVRVIRGAHRGSPFAPDHGFRYDGNYVVTDAFVALGRSGFRVWRFVLQRFPLRTPEAAQWSPAQRRVVQLYDAACQICGIVVRTRTGHAANPWHIVPTHHPHHGSDALTNLLCLCPNHAQQTRAGSVVIHPDGSLAGAPGRLQLAPGHSIDPHALRYLAVHYPPILD